MPCNDAMGLGQIMEQKSQHYMHDISLLPLQITTYQQQIQHWSKQGKNVCLKE